MKRRSTRRGSAPVVKVDAATSSENDIVSKPDLTLRGARTRLSGNFSHSSEVRMWQCCPRGVLAGAIALCLLVPARLAAQTPVGTAFTYQGRLTDAGAPAAGSYDLEFKLYDALTAGTQVGSTQTKTGVSVSSGLFSVALDFGASAFAGSKRWLEIGVRPGGSSGAFTALTPRQELAPAPNAIYAANAATIGGIACAANQVPKWSGTAWTCAADNDGVSAVTASAPLASSGGLTPNVSLSGIVPVANGGTGNASLTTNGVLFGQGTGAVGNAVGVAGQVLTGTASAPAWTGSPSLSGNITLVGSTASVGNILKGANRFIHNFGAGNTFIGENAGNFTMTGVNNTASGVAALNSNTTGNFNTASGGFALFSNTTGTDNTASGLGALFFNTTGVSNTASGVNALQFNTTASKNTAIGLGALQVQSFSNANTPWDSFNTAVGFQALFSNQPTTTSNGVNNTAIGADALFANTTGNHNTASGERALFSNTIGDANTASSARALFSNTTGFNNTAIGIDALFNNTTGFNNTASGGSALSSNTTGSSNTASGRIALAGNTTGNDNTASGVSALINNTTGSSNIGIGRNAGFNLTTGNDNIAIGNFGVGAESATIRIGSGQTRTFIAGIRGVTTGVADAVNVFVDSAGQLGTVSSSRRFKDDIAAMDAASAGLMKLRPVTFHYKTDQNPAGRTLQYGLIAEEVALVYPGLVARSADGRIETVLYQFLPPMLLNEVQRQQRTIQALTARIAELEKQALEIAALKQQSAKLAAALERLGHKDNTNFDLKVAHCNDTACATAGTATLDSTGAVGEYTSITIGADGLGLISYNPGPNNDLEVAHCSNTLCTPNVRRR